MKTVLNRKAKQLFAGLLVLMILEKGTSVVFPLIVENAIDAGVDGTWAKVWQYMIVLCVVAAVAIVAGVLDQVAEQSYSNCIADTYRKRIADYISHLEPEEYAKRESAEYISIFNNNISIVINNFYLCILHLMRCVLVVVFTVSALFSLNWILALLIIGTSILTVVSPLLFRGKLNRQNNAINASLKHLNAMFEDFLRGYLTGRIYRAQQKFSKRLEMASEQAAAENVKYWVYMQQPNLLTSLIGYSKDVFLVGIGIYLMLHGKLTVGGLFAAVQLSNLLATPTVNISYLISNVTSTRDMKKELDDMCYVEPAGATDRTSDRADGSENVQTPVDIDIRNLSLSYGEKEVLRNISFHFEAGKKYLLVGESGCGKSSLLRILAGLNPNYSGEALADGTKLQQMDMDAWYQRTGIALQDSVLFHDSMYNNMTLWDQLSADRLDECVAALNLTKLAKEKGVQKNSIGSKGNESGKETDAAAENDCGGEVYSGGEQQRIALVRVLLEKKGLLLIDEATSALDNVNSRQVEQLLLDLKDCTVISITHKIHPDLAGQYDGILFLQDGVVTSVGTYEELVRKSPDFVRFISASSNA